VWKDLTGIRMCSKVTPGIRDYVNSTVSGKEIPALSYENARELGLLSDMDLLPRMDILQKEVLVPSVFSPSWWCCHKLPVPELMDIFDFEVCVQKGTLEMVKNPSVAFVKEPPGKLLHRLMVAESTPISSTVGGSRGTPVQVSNEDITDSVSEKVPAESTTHHADAATAHANAARADDAPVNEEEWNKWLAQG